MSLSRQQQTIVICHGPCADGWTGAWVYWRTLDDGIRAALSKYGGFYSADLVKLEELMDVDGELVSPTSLKGATAILSDPKGPNVAFAFIWPNDRVDVAQLIKGRAVVLIDIVLKQLEEVAAECASLLVFDHHAGNWKLCDTVREAWKDKPEKNVHIVFDETRSAAGIVWSHYYLEKHTPKLVTYVQARDLWKMKSVHKCEEVCVALDSHFKSFSDLETVHLRWLENPDAVTTEFETIGSCILDFEATQIDNLIDQANVMQMEVVRQPLGEESNATATATLVGASQPQRYNALVINTSSFVSKLGDRAMQKLSPATEDYHMHVSMKRADQTFEKVKAKIALVAMWWYDSKTDKCRVSLRTTRVPEINLANIAGACLGADAGGGGHPGAAGFTITGDSISKVFKKFEA